MRFAAVQIPAKIGWCSLNGEKLDELHCVALIFGQFAVLNAHSTPISSRRNLQGGLFIVPFLFYGRSMLAVAHHGHAPGGSGFQ